MNGFQKMNRAVSTTQVKDSNVKRSLGYVSVDLAINERALLYKNKQLVDILGPGRHAKFDFLGSYEIDLYNIVQAKFSHEAFAALHKANTELLEQHFEIVHVGANQAGVVYQDGVLTEILAPGSQAAYWKGLVRTDIELVNIDDQINVSSELSKVLTHSSVLGGGKAVLTTEIQEKHLGLLLVDGKLVDTLEAGLHGFWRFNRNVMVQHVDLRLQALEVQGQEILTKDKVSLRVNLSASYSIVDAVKAAQSVQNLKDHLYRELQLGLREAVGTRRLDELLANKDEVNHIVSNYMRDKASDVGVWIEHVGVKDIILPGEMKTILNKVVEAEKAAQANVIKRREETAATRSLLNTAKVMEDNPVLLRLKELESLEKVVEKVGALNVYNGLDGMMDDLVRIKKR